MDGLRPMFIEKLGPYNIQTYTEMVQRAQLVEDTMAKVEGMRGKDISKLTFIKRGAVDTTGTFPNNNNNNNNNNYNNKRPTTGKDYGMEKKIKVEETKTVEYCNFFNKPGHRADECWKKAGACLRCGNHDHRLPNCPMLKDQAGRNQMNNMGGHRVVWRSSWWLRSCGTTTRRRSSCPSRLLRPAQTTLLKLTKEQPYVKRRKDRFAIQGTVLALSEPCTDPVNATAQYVAFRGLIVTYPLSLSQGDMRSVTIYLPDLTSLSRCLHTCVAFWARPVAFLT
ncbi:hypothetical protein Taro_012734 [Colocasia esculenta]|uniref:CCHC-type domain-containing protein n=1 Tax=Colocasia esculenta TaxID=4460 RepID=A0A843U9L2_COLES|nr:hypothetical protein [Colocasia esculenta]